MDPKTAHEITSTADAVAARSSSLCRLLHDGDTHGAEKLARDMRLMLVRIERACKLDNA